MPTFFGVWHAHTLLRYSEIYSATKYQVGTSYLTDTGDSLH
jgi:hypothetical protein